MQFKWSKIQIAGLVVSSFILESLAFSMPLKQLTQLETLSVNSWIEKSISPRKKKATPFKQKDLFTKKTDGFPLSQLTSRSETLVGEWIQPAKLKKHVSEKPVLATLKDVVVEAKKTPQPAAVTKGNLDDLDTPPKENYLLITRLENKSLLIEPSHINFDTINQSISLNTSNADLAKSGFLYVRNKSMLKIDFEKKTITAQKEGDTELYLIDNSHMYIIPVSIARPSSAPRIKIPDMLTRLDSIVQGNGLNKQTFKAYKKPASPQTSDIERTKKEALDTLKKEESKRFILSPDRTSYSSLSIQVMDDRSLPQNGVVYPAVNIKAHILGTDFKSNTSATGHLLLPDIPNNSHLLLALEDSSGFYANSIVEVSSYPDIDKTKQVRLIRKGYLDNLANSAGTSQLSYNSSFCANLYNSEGLLLSDVEVDLDISPNGAFYFNKFGYIDSKATALGPNGKVCFFNIDPGPGLLTIEGYGSIPINFYAGAHLEKDLYLNEALLSTRIAAMPTAHEQLSDDSATSNNYRSIDMVDLYAFGEEAPFAQEGYGVLKSSEKLLSYNSKIFAGINAAEFEPTIYSYDTLSKKDQITPLIPRGFVEDMSVFAQVPIDPTLGTLVVEYGYLNGQGDSPVDINVFDSKNNKLGQGWYYHDGDITKAIFFNLQAGEYSILAETQEGYWLSADTALIYNESVSYKNIGSKIQAN